MESELFGYEKGAFTGAEKEGRPGKFEMADGGTIFLDEIGDMPLNIQATLLRVIQTKEVVRIGGEYPKPINIRIIAATNQDLMKAVKNKEFREDLYYRLNVYTINTPPLRKRGASDIRLLTDHFIRYHSRSKSSNIIVSPEVYEILENYCWPGNVRQLENIIERAVNLTGEDRTIRYEHLPDDVTANECTTPLHIEHNDSPHVYESAAQKNEKNSFGAHESHQIVSALQRSGGNVTRAAKFLDMNLRTLYRRLQKYEIDANDYRN